METSLTLLVCASAGVWPPRTGDAELVNCPAPSRKMIHIDVNGVTKGVVVGGAISALLSFWAPLVVISHPVLAISLSPSLCLYFALLIFPDFLSVFPTEHMSNLLSARFILVSSTERNLSPRHS